MKRLTMNQVAKASLKANKKAYLSLTICIFLAVYLCSASVLCIQGILAAQDEQMARRMGWGDTFLPNQPFLSDDYLRGSGCFDELGHIFVTASVENSGVYTGYYDETAEKLMYRRCLLGRMPEKAGEIAAEQSALDKLGYEDVTLGDVFTFTMHPFNGAEEERTYTLVGILNEQSSYFDVSSYTSYAEGTARLPAILVSPQEPTYEIGDVVIHRIATDQPLVNFDIIYEKCNGLAFHISRVAGDIQPYVFLEQEWNLRVQQVSVWAFLGIALLLTVCVGISTAMESMLAQKTEEIGMLRAVGATRRQIRRVFGRSAWLLALTALPVGLALGCLTCWIFSLMSPGSILFRPSLFVLLFIGLIAFLCIELSSFLPLRRASRQTPLGVLRDTRALRLAKRFRSRKVFKATGLIANRQFRFHPLRYAGSAAMISLMLLCAIVFGQVFLYRSSHTENETVAFILSSQEFDQGNTRIEPFAWAQRDEGMTENDLNQIRALPLVNQVKCVTWTRANLLLEGELPTYLNWQSLGWTDENGEEIYTIYTRFDIGIPNDSYLDCEDDGRESYMYASFGETRAMQMRALQKVSGVTQKLLPAQICVMTFTEEELRNNVTDGRIDMDAIDAGREILVYAPNVCFKINSGRNSLQWTSINKLFDDEIHPKDWDAVRQNDFFYSGQPLPLLQAAQEHWDNAKHLNFRPYIPEDMQTFYSGFELTQTTPIVGAVLKGALPVRYMFSMGEACLITTPKGAQAMGLMVPGPEEVQVSLKGDPDLETETALARTMERIAVRRNMYYINQLSVRKEIQANKLRTVLLFIGLVALFFGVSVAMQIGNASRRIRSDQRMIGTLRAVGADGKALLGCYRLPTVLSAICGSLLAGGIFSALVLTHVIGNTFQHEQLWFLAPLVLLLTALAVLCSMIGIRARLRQVLNKSVVENIREL